MQIVIDIDKSLYNAINQDLYINGMRSGKTILQKLVRAIANGTVLPDNDCDSCKKAWTDKCERAECYENNYKHWTPYQKGDNSEYLGGELYQGEFENR